MRKVSLSDNLSFPCGKLVFCQAFTGRLKLLTHGASKRRSDILFFLSRGLDLLATY